MEYEGGREPEGEELTSDKSEEVEEKPLAAAAVAAQVPAPLLPSGWAVWCRAELRGSGYTALLSGTGR
jgi:hypothetical protein